MTDATGSSRGEAAGKASSSGPKRRHEVLAMLGLEPPTVRTLVRAALDRAITDAAVRRPDEVTVLDAGCGRKSQLVPFRKRIHRLVGVDIHAPDPPLPHLDEFAIVDLCGSPGAFPEGTFDLVLSNFTVEHFADPPAAFANLGRWTRPGGTLVITTVNRRHPFVAAYLSMPSGPQRRLQPIVKASPADAHPLVGSCNDPALIRQALVAAGFEQIVITTVSNLARAWGRRLPTWAVGAVGDLLTRDMPGRRATIVAVARRPALA